MKISTKSKVFTTAAVIGFFLAWIPPSIFTFFYLREKVGSPNEQMGLLVSRLVDNSRGPDGLPNLKLLEKVRAGLSVMQFDFWLVDGDGRIVDSLAEGKSIVPSTADFPTQFSENYQQPRLVSRLTELSRATLVTRVSSVPPYYLYIQQDRPGYLGKTMFTITGIVSVWAAMVTAFVALIFMVRYFRSRAREVVRVMTRIREGHLAERFKISQLDEVGELMAKFNEMASELERAVMQLRQADSLRVRLLREISHDLRTPLTGAKVAADALCDVGEKLSSQERLQCAEITASEIRYLQHIVDDLFFLAEVEAPKYRSAAEPLSLQEFFEDEWSGIQKSLATRRKKTLSLAPVPEVFISTTRTGLIRLLRNAIENATRFARTTVSIHVDSSEDEVCIVIRDDGPGVTAEKIAQFGSNPAIPRLGEFSEGESMGIGSSIIKAVTLQSGGTASLTNWEHGAQLVVTLPRLRVATNAVA